MVLLTVWGFPETKNLNLEIAGTARPATSGLRAGAFPLKGD